MKLLIIPILFLFSSNVEAENKSFESLLTDFKKIPGKDFNTKIEVSRKGFDRYFEIKGRICQGDFSTVILGESTNNDKSSKLSRSEIKACLNNLTNERIVFIDALYELRKSYLTYLHSLQLEQLNKSKQLEVAKWKNLKTAK
jgi:hypothetical protein